MQETGITWYWFFCIREDWLMSKGFDVVMVWSCATDLKNGGTIKHGIWKLKRIMRLVGSYPEMALWEPIFRVWHYGWRKMHIIKK